MGLFDLFQPSRPVDLDSISGLDANEWKVRLEAIDNFYDLVRTNPEGVCKNVSKVGILCSFLSTLQASSSSSSSSSSTSS